MGVMLLVCFKGDWVHSYTVGCGDPMWDKGVHDREGEGCSVGHL